MGIELRPFGEMRWILPKGSREGMNVPGLVYGDDYILKHLEEENVLAQVANVACLPGIQRYSYAMPDIHWGYGFPIGGVAAFSMDEGVVSPGGVGYDISCGVRLMLADMDAEEIASKLELLAAALFNAVPSGVGSSGALRLKEKDLKDVLAQGARWAVKRGYGVEADLEHIEEGGGLASARPDAVSNKALERGFRQLGTLGSGNHFLEIQRVDEIYDPQAAALFGMRPNQVAIMIHCGSRGLGHQVCTDYIEVMNRAMRKYGVSVPDRQLCCTPLASQEAQAYIGAMQAAANFAMANRQVIAHFVRSAFAQFFPGCELRLLYDVSHNMAHIEEHEHAVDGRVRKLCVHRKGATRALPAGHPKVPQVYREVGQPVIIPGSMGTASYLLVGTQLASEECFSSTCHGAGRVMSRHAARKATDGASVVKSLARQGVVVMAEDMKTVEEEAPEAYKDVSRVVDVVERAGISRKVARLRPLSVVKG